MTSLADFLGLLGAGAGASQAYSPGAALTPDQLAALPNINMRQAQGATSAQAPKPSFGSKLKDLIGGLGDALYSAAGGRGEGEYAHQQTQSALSNYLGDPQGSIAQLMKVNAPLGISLLAASAKAKQEADQAMPEPVRDLRAMGIDPSSEQGKELISAHLGKAPVAGIAEYQYYTKNGGKLPFSDFLRIIHPPAGYDLQETGGGSAPKPGGALRYNPQTGGWAPE